MKPDIMDVKPKVKVDTTMYEVNDSGRNGEINGSHYFSSFVSFIESLGYDVETRPHSENIKIKGIEFCVNTGNASFMSRNSYTRITSIRKPQNRFITLSWSSWGSNYILKVFINKEMETAKLKQKIDKAIEWYNNRDKEIADRQLNDQKNTETIGLHYFGNATIKSSVNRLLVHQGEITFSFHDRFYLIIKADSSFSKAEFHPNEMKSIDEVESFANSILARSEDFESVCRLILDAGKISDELIEWSKGQHHKYFYTKTMSTENN